MKQTQSFLTRGFTDMKRWAHAHPIKACSFVLLLLVLGVLGLVLDAVWSLICVLMLLGIGYGLWTWIFTRDMKRLGTLVLAGSLLFNPQPLRAAPLVIGGLFVLVVGGVIGCRIVKRCEKAVRGRTNAWPEELRFQIAGETGEYGALFSWSEEGYCLEERLLHETPTVFTLNIVVESPTNASVTCIANTGERFVQSWGEFTEEAAANGLAITAGPPLSSYARNRHPVQPEQVPIGFDFATRTVTLGAGGVLVTVERSNDLQVWEPFMKANAEVGARLELADVSEESATFWRVTTKQSP